MADEQLLQQHSLRSWLQACGCPQQQDRRCNPFHFYGSDNHMFEISVVEENVQGALVPIRILKGSKGDWSLVGTVQRPPGRQRFALSYFEACKPYLPFLHSLRDKPFTVYELVGDCPQIGDPSNGWSSYVMIYSDARMEQRRSQTRTSRTSQAPVDNQLLGTVDTIYYYTPVYNDIASAGMTGTHDATARVAGIAFDPFYSCPSCGALGDCATCGSCGSSFPANPGKRFYSLCQKGTNIYVDVYDKSIGVLARYPITSYDPDVVGTAYGPGGPAINTPTLIATDIVIYNRQLVVSMSSTTDEAGIYVADILADGTLSSFWQKSVLPIKSLAVSSDWLVMGGVAGTATSSRIYVSRSPNCDQIHEVLDLSASGAITWNDIDVRGTRVLAGGSGGKLVMSRNGGVSWRMLASPTTYPIVSVAINESDYWVGTSTQADLWTSCNGGLTWALVASSHLSAEIALPAGSSAGIWGIRFANRHVGFFTSGNRLFGTYSGGAYWNAGCPRFEFSPSASRVIDPQAGDTMYHHLAVLSSDDSFDPCNHVLTSCGPVTNGQSNATNNNVLWGRPIIEGQLLGTW